MSVSLFVPDQLISLSPEQCSILRLLTRIQESVLSDDNDDIHDGKLSLQVIKEGSVITGDLGGSAKCSEFTNEIIRKIEAM